MSDDAGGADGVPEGGGSIGRRARRAIITGASSGIGRELAIELARRGWRTALTARNAEALEQTAAAVRSAGGEALVVPGDVTRPEDLERAVRTALEAWGGIDLAVANAGQGFPTPVAHLDLPAATALMRTNFEGTLNLLAAVVPHMIERRSGQFVGIASLAGWRGLPGTGVYSASKAAMQALLEAARVELAPHGVAVTKINPGFIRTAMTAKNRFPMPFLMDV
ncbi:MAG TPA: SDR family oxidoreductase, partial [Thermoanaerobaculia bacterium]|nr:SDR family oxidoreductase [Thermoanaerobaculia bacterium]